MEEVGCVKSHFLDSGAFSLKKKAIKYAKENHCEEWGYYDLPEFWEYVDSYACFVKRYSIGIDLYANVDVIPNAKLTYRNQRYLEKKHGLNPVPVVHCGCDLKWLKHYMERGHEIIGLGGLVGNAYREGGKRWMDKVFDFVCDAPDRLPRAKLHGFGIASFSLLLRYPWYSVDTATWAHVASYGGICVPHKRCGEFVYNKAPYIVKTSNVSPEITVSGRSHFMGKCGAEKGLVLEWLEEINIPFGDDNNKGVSNNRNERLKANVLFFDRMQNALPEYPLPFRSKRLKGFGLV